MHKSSHTTSKSRLNTAPSTQRQHKSHLTSTNRGFGTKRTKLPLKQVTKRQAGFSLTRHFSTAPYVPSMSTTHPTTDTLPLFRTKEETSKDINQDDKELTPKRPQRPLKVAFFGASDITPAVFDALYSAIDMESAINKDSTRDYPLVGEIDVVTSPPVMRLVKGKKTLEPSPLMAHVQAKYPNVSVSHYSPDKTTPFRSHYELEKPKGHYDLAVVFSFPRLIPPRLIDQFSMGMINIHPSLIPLYRGPSPMQAALENNDLETGISIITIAPHKFDVGQVIAQRKFDIPKNLTLETMTPIVQSVGIEMMMNLIEKWDEIRPHSVSQDTIMQHYTTTLPESYLTPRLHAPKYGSTISPSLENLTGKQIYGLWRGLVGFRQIHAKVLGKPKIDKKTGEVSYKEPARIIFAEMGLDEEDRSVDGGNKEEIQQSGQGDLNKNVQNDQKDQNDQNVQTHTDPSQPSSRPHLYYNLSEFQPGPEIGDAIFDPHLNAVRIRCAQDSTLLITKFMSTTGQPSDAKAIINGQFVKEAGKFRGKFYTNADEDAAKM